MKPKKIKSLREWAMKTNGIKFKANTSYKPKTEYEAFLYSSRKGTRCEIYRGMFCVWEGTFEKEVQDESILENSIQEFIREVRKCHLKGGRLWGE